MLVGLLVGSMSPPVSACVKLLHESLGHVVSVEIRTGEVLRGHLAHVEDNMNLLLETVTRIAVDGSTKAMGQVYVRGSTVRFFQLPEMLKHAPFLKSKKPEKRQLPA